MSSIELNKAFAAVLTAGIIAMGTGLVARVLVPEAHHEENAYIIDTGAGLAEVVVEEVVLAEIGPMLASADPDAGQAASRACSACHSFEEGGANKVGPNLYDIVGRPIGAAEGFNYSTTLADLNGSGEAWTYESLSGFIAAPRDYAPGTAMTYAGVKDDADRADMIAWLRTLSGSPQPLP